MSRGWFVSLVQSRVFGIVWLVAMVIVTATYVYVRFVRAGSSGGELNISCFAYRDVNRNGIYDLGDRPYAELRVALDRPSGRSVAVTSNIAGFANFTMARRGWHAAITNPGRYTITVDPPRDWIITTGNPRQTVSFKRLESAPAGMVAEQPILPVGIAPELTISGSVAPGASNSHGTAEPLRATSPSGNTITVPISATGQFRLAAEPGEWQLAPASAAEPTIPRTVTVRDYAVVLSTIDRRISAPPAKPVRRRVDFDTLTTSDTLLEVPHGYAGLNWTNWVATHQKLYRAPGTINGAVSSEYVAYNSSGHPAMVWSDRAFDLEGVYVSVSWPDAERYDLLVRAWRGDQLVYQDRLRGRVAGPVYFDADYRDITRVEFASESYWQLVIDDLEFRTDE